MSPHDARAAALLAKAPIFQDLPESLRASCAAAFRETHVPKGRMIFARGDKGGHLYVIASGQVRLAVATGEGRELSFQVAQEGALFGEIAVLDGGPRSAEATALEAATLLSLATDEFRRLRDAHPELAQAVTAHLCRRLREVSENLETIALYPLHVRLARFLVAATGGRTAPPGRRVPFELRFSQNELAMLLGATRSKTNAALDALETAGALKRTQDRLFCDVAALAATAQAFDAGEGRL